jgi:hypothetical protein
VIGAQLFGHPAASGQGVLQPLREGHETLAAVDDLPIGPATRGAQGFPASKPGILGVPLQARR